MKKCCLSVVVLFFLLLSQEGIGQTIEYDFRNPDTIVGALPFDRKFHIKFTHIDTARVNLIVVRIYEVGVTNYKKVLKQAGYTRSQIRNATPKIAITNRDIINAQGKPVIIPDTIIKYVHFRDSTAYTTSAITLRPSTDYFIEINTIESIPLTDKEKEMLAKNIRKAPGFTRLINDFADKNIIDANTSFDPLNDLSNSINTEVDKVARKTNDQYNYHPVSILKQLGNFYTDIANIGSKLSDISENFKTLQKSDSLTKIIRDGLLTIDWVNIDKNSNEYKKIVDLIEKQRNALAAGPNAGAADNLDRTLREIEQSIDHLQTVMETLVSKVLVEHVDKGIATASTYPKEFLKQAGEFIRSDLGLAYVWGIGRANPYVAAQISLGPLDDSIPLREYKGFGNVMRSRLSFMIGISVDAIAKDSVRRGLIGSQALILGTGFKLWQWLKLNSGFYLYYSEPKNPLLDRSRLTFKGSPFISLSIDIRIQSLLNGVGNAIFKTQTP